ncbi:hypothetical protein J4468_00915 [Candidatus Woesearchaeota archaeon]|nr:hypothetical protein [Candidatus Woesearchaeota archaeon]
MSDIKILEERPISMVEVKSALDKSKKDNELNFRALKASEYMNAFVKLKPKEYKELYDKIEALAIPRLKDKHIIKILDIMPQEIESMKALFINDTVTVKQDDLKRILEALK